MLSRDSNGALVQPQFFEHRPRLTLAGARAVLDAAIARASEIGVPENIAVVDDGGSLLAFARMDGARPGSIEIALTKAISAATRRRATAEEGGGDPANGIRLALAAGRLTQLGGGIPLMVGDATVGAVGVSSGTIDEDVTVAKAAAEAFSA